MFKKIFGTICIFAFCQTSLAQTYEDVAKETYTQSDFETYMTCAGIMEGSHELLLHLQSLYPDHQKSFFDPYIENGVSIYDNYVTQRVAASKFAPHIDLAAAQKFYDQARAPFDNKKSASINDQWDFWKSNAKIGQTCRDATIKTNSLYRVWQYQ